MIGLAAMQGLGKPGRAMWSTTHGVPCDFNFWFPGYSEGGISGDGLNTAAGRLAAAMWPKTGATGNPQHSAEGQTVSRLRIPEAMMHEHHEWRGRGFGGGSIEAQFKKYEYPAPGYAPVGMYYKYGNSFIGTMTETNRYVRAYREGKVPFVVSQAVWFEGETQVRRHRACRRAPTSNAGTSPSGPALAATARTASISATTASSCSRRSASNRWASQSPTTRSSRSSRNVSASASFTPRDAATSTG